MGHFAAAVCSGRPCQPAASTSCQTLSLLHKGCPQADALELFAASKTSGKHNPLQVTKADGTLTEEARARREQEDRLLEVAAEVGGDAHIAI